MNFLKIKGVLFRKPSKKVDKNGNDYYHGWLDCDDGSRYVFFFFNPDYDLNMRLEDLPENQELTLQGSWGKREPAAFIGRDFYLEEEMKSDSSFDLDNDKFDDWKTN